MKHDIIIIGADPWEHYTWRRRHHVAWNLAKKNRVLFIEPPLTLVQPFVEIDLSWKHLFNINKLKHHGRNLFTYSPWRKYPRSLPLSNIFNYEEMSQNYVFKKIKRIVNRLKFNDPILWVYYHPDQYDYSGLFKEKIMITDWYDKVSALVGAQVPPEVMGEIKRKEEKILNKANIVFSVSEELARDISGKNNNVFVVPHGVDIDNFQRTTDYKNKILKKIKKIKSPVLGYLGLIHNKLDIDLLNYIARQKPDMSIILMGKKWLGNKKDVESFSDLKKKKNVFYTGELEREFIPLYLKHIDVCLIPLKKMEFNRYATGPLKLWQYFAAGKPVVAVDQGVEYDCEEYIYKASDYDKFILMVEKALNDAQKENISKKRIALAENNSWKRRVEEMLNIIDEQLQYVKN